MVRSRALRLGVLLSGGGRTLENLFKEIDAGRLTTEVVVVIADRADAFGLERAKKRGIQTHLIERENYPSTASFSEAIADVLRNLDVELVAMAGFLALWKIPKDFIHRVMNIHPALLPAFGGKGFYGERVHRAVHRSGVRFTGCTVHFANDEYDAGPIILQAVVHLDQGDTVKDIARKVFEAECDTYPKAIRLFAEGRLTVRGSRVEIRESTD